MLPIQRKISQYNHYKGNDIKYIIIHYVGANSTAKNNVDYFFNGDRQASAHYFVDDISIWQSVEDFNGAWHIGNSVTEPNNKNSIGIEMCLVDGVVTEKTESNTIDLVKYLMEKYDVAIENVRTHAEVTNYSKICPNWSDANWDRWKKFKAKLQSTRGWKKNTIGWWYDNGDGTYPKNQWLELKEIWYYFDDRGYAFQNKWLKWKNKWYWFDNDCKMVKGCVLKINNKYYAFNDIGEMIEDNIPISKNGNLLL